MKIINFAGGQFVGSAFEIVIAGGLLKIVCPIEPCDAT